MPHQRRRAVLAIALVTTVATVLASCSGDDDDSETSSPTTTATTDDGAAPGTDAAPGTAPQEPAGEPTLTYGFIGPGVGLLNELAIGQERGLTLAMQEINAAGGVLGGPVASVRVDESSSAPIDGVIDDLVGQGANLLVGPVSSSSTAAVLPILAERSLLSCSASATATSLTVGNTPATFVRTALRDDYFADIVADDVMVPADGSAAPATVTIVGRDDVYGNELIGALSADLTARGAAVDTILYPARRVSFPDEAAEVAAAAPDLVILASYTEGPNLVAQLVAAGQPVDRIIGLDGFLVPRIAEQTFPDDPTRADGFTVIGTTGDRALMTRLAQVPAAQDQTSYGAQMYDCVISLALGAIAAGSTVPDVVGQQLIGVTSGGRVCSTFAHCVELLAAGEDIDYDGATGHIGFDDTGDISSARVTTSVVIDGVLQPTSAEDIDLVALQQEAIFASAVFVTQLQQALKVLGYFEGDITGVYDEATTAAVAALQRDLGLPETGQFDEATDAALRERLGVRIGAFGSSVSQLQQALADRGYYTGPIDGRYSAATIEAVKAFQRDLGVPETGVIDVATLQAIYVRGIVTGIDSVPPPTTVPPETTTPPTLAPPPPPPPDTTAAPAPTTTAGPPDPGPPDPEPPDTTLPQPTQNLFQVLAAQPELFSTLTSIIVAAGDDGVLAGAPLLTVFAPTNDAFAGFDVDELTDDPEAAQDFLRDLAVDGDVTTEDLQAGPTLPTVRGDTELVVTDNGATVGGAPIVGDQIVATNGTVHAVKAIPQATPA